MLAVDTKNIVQLNVVGTVSIVVVDTTRSTDNWGYNFGFR
jgi:hypothetical protein